MIVANIIKHNQPDVYFVLKKVFRLDEIEIEERPPITYVITPEFPEDNINFQKYQEIMNERKAVEL